MSQESLFEDLIQPTPDFHAEFPPSLLIGTGGWNYKDWIGPFYPSYLDRSEWLTFYSQQFSTLEVDSSFYAMPEEHVVRRWYNQTPDGFLFTAKVPKLITHGFVNRMSLLGEKLGPLLLQFPPAFSIDGYERIHRFLPTLPADHRFAVEIRHPSWLCDKFYDLLRANNVALTLSEITGMPRLSVTTADFTYIRWIGDHRDGFDYFGSIQADRTEDLDDWLTVILKKFMPQDLEVFAYFNNHFAGFSPGSIKQLYERYQKMTGNPTKK